MSFNKRKLMRLEQVAGIGRCIQPVVITDQRLLNLLANCEPVGGGWPDLQAAVAVVLSDSERVERELALDDRYLADPPAAREARDVTKPEAGLMAT